MKGNTNVLYFSQLFMTFQWLFQYITTIHERGIKLSSKNYLNIIIFHFGKQQSLTMFNHYNYDYYHAYQPLARTRMQTMPEVYYRNPPIQEQQIKVLVQHMKMNEKMKIIDQRQNQYKRSSNNCHKKYIAILKNHFFLKLQQQVKDQIERKYKMEQNSRVYFFILLSYMKWMIEIEAIKQVYTAFCDILDQKICCYKKEIGLTRNTNFINFRYAQVKEMEYALSSIRDYFKGQNQLAIRNLFQKDKAKIIKKNQYFKSIQIIQQLEKQLTIFHPQIYIDVKLRDLDIASVREVKLLQPFPILIKTKLQSHEFTTNTKIKLEINKEDFDCDSDYVQDEQNQAIGKKKVIDLTQEIKQSNGKSQIKIEEHVPTQSGCDKQKMMPLLKLQISYPPVNFDEWHLFIIQRQMGNQLMLKAQENILNLVQENKINIVSSDPEIKVEL